MNLIKLLITLTLLTNNASGMEALNELDILEKNRIERITLNVFPNNQDNYFSQFENFKKSFRQSIHSFLNSYDDGNQTPLDIYYDIAVLKFSKLEDKHREEENFESFLKSEFRSIINSPETTLSLIQNDEENETNFNLSSFWIFRLKIPALSDFSFWCAISKEDLEPPFVFGMN